MGTLYAFAHCLPSDRASATASNSGCTVLVRALAIVGQLLVLQNFSSLPPLFQHGIWVQAEAHEPSSVHLLALADLRMQPPPLRSMGICLLLSAVRSAHQGTTLAWSGIPDARPTPLLPSGPLF